jgi:hypothetical protein
VLRLLLLMCLLLACRTNVFNAPDASRQMDLPGWVQAAGGRSVQAEKSPERRRVRESSAPVDATAVPNRLALDISGCTSLSTLSVT